MSSLQPVSNSFTHCQLVYVSESQDSQVADIQALIITHQLPIILHLELFTAKLNQKRRQQLSQTATQPILLLDDKNKLSWLSDGLSVAPEWDKLQRRVVSAGRKSELLLQYGCTGHYARAAAFDGAAFASRTAAYECASKLAKAYESATDYQY
jgi:16S rRNA (guanine1516-N2)-methyltransferase